MSMIGHVCAIPESQGRLLLLGEVSSLFDLFYSDDPEKHVSLEKSWHGLHYLLTGDAMEESGPLAFLLAGGTEVPDADSGYGPARIFSPAETGEVNAALADIDDSALWSRFDADAMEGLYGFSSNQSEEAHKENYLHYFHGLKQLVAAAASRGESLVVILL
jgi:hypothetical protein